MTHSWTAQRSRGRQGLALVVLALMVGMAAVLGIRVMRSWPHIPTMGVMLHPFGVPVRYQNCGFHTGQDWFAPTGAPIYAIADGVVAYVGPLWLDGPDVGRGPYAIILDHGTYRSTYSHNRAALVQAGEQVRRGQRIAELGDEGFAGGPHLHLEVVASEWTGDWQRPFAGCDGYRDPGRRWSPF
ncbi:MAG TPA: M23 family metallopeptidase [Ardenticatenaceae bacterium]|nr:M23 family metallopeptidase [Ardenticatenaceae bacterium]